MRQHTTSLHHTRLRFAEESGQTSITHGMRPNRTHQLPRRRQLDHRHVCFVHPPVHHARSA